MQRILPERVIQWKKHTVTEAVIEFLNDYANQLRSDHADRFEAGQLLPDGKEDVARGYINALRDMALIDAKTINHFYQQEEENGIHTDAQP